MQGIRLFHNPRCSKSRATLELLRSRGVEPEIIDYLHAPPTRGELAAVQRALGLPARELARSGDPLYAELGLDASAADADVIDAIARHPALLQRPIAIRGDRAVIGRPPERVLDLLD